MHVQGSRCKDPDVVACARQLDDDEMLQSLLSSCPKPRDLSKCMETIYEVAQAARLQLDPSRHVNAAAQKSAILRHNIEC